MGGMFAAIAIMASLRERERTGRGGLVQSGLFETCMVLVGQHMANAAIEGRNPPTYGDPVKVRPWPVYDIFDSADPDQQVFVGVVTETQWRQFCESFDLMHLLNDPGLQTPKQRADERPRILPHVQEAFRKFSKAELMARCEALGVPFAPIAKPADLFDDPHLLASGGLFETDLTGSQGAPGGQAHQAMAGLPGLPIELIDGRPGLRRQPPQVGEHGPEIAREAGFSENEIAALVADGTLAVPGGGNQAR
jgi:crotonobetainyl-CoA:carnitine CoA-transferase CaiB-like acyl-CoA transferase